MRDLRYLVGMSQRARRALAHRWVGVFRWPEELDSWRLAKRRGPLSGPDCGPRR